MTTPEAALRYLLVSGSPNPVADLVAPRVYTDVLPQGVVYPAIRFQRISTVRSRFRDLSGFANYAQVRMQLDVWSLSRSQALAVAQAVIALLDGFRGYAGGVAGSPTDLGLRIDALNSEDERGDFEPGVGPGGAGAYRQSLDFFMWFPE